MIGYPTDGERDRIERAEIPNIFEFDAASEFVESAPETFPERRGSLQY